MISNTKTLEITQNRMENWEIRDLADCVDVIIDYRGKTPKKLGGDWSQDGIRAISAKNVKHGEIVNEESIKYLSVDLYNKWMKEEIKKGDLILTSEAPLGESLFWDSDEKIVLSQRLYAIRPNNKIIYPKYFAVYVNSEYFQHELESRSTGTTVTGIRQSELLKTKVILPTYEEQKFIGDLIFNINKKIMSNNHISEMALAAANEIFNQWFLKFEFLNENKEPYFLNGGKLFNSEWGNIPDGWKVGSLSEIANFLNGLAMQKYRPEDAEYIPVIKIKELKQGFTNEKSDKATPNLEEKYKIDNGDIIFSWSGSLEAKIWLGGIGGLNQHLFKVTSKKYNKWFYFFWVLYHIDEFRRIAADKATTMGHIRRKDLDEAKVLIPSHEVYQDADKIISPFIEMFIEKGIENTTLKGIKDILSYKLLSGEIKIPKKE